MTHEQILDTFLIFMICLFVFAIIREIVCWYFKINERVSQGNEIIKQLQQINLHNANLALNPIILDDGRIFISKAEVK